MQYIENQKLSKHDKTTGQSDGKTDGRNPEIEGRNQIGRMQKTTILVRRMLLLPIYSKTRQENGAVDVPVRGYIVRLYLVSRILDHVSWIASPSADTVLLDRI